MSCAKLSEWCAVLIAPVQDGKEEDIRAIIATMLHGQVDVLYVLSDTICDLPAPILYTIVRLSGFWAPHKRATQSLGHPQGLSPLRRCSSGSSQSLRSITKRLSTSGRALTLNVFYAVRVHLFRALRLSHHVVLL